MSAVAAASLALSFSESVVRTTFVCLPGGAKFLNAGALFAAAFEAFLGAGATARGGGGSCAGGSFIATVGEEDFARFGKIGLRSFTGECKAGFGDSGGGLEGRGLSLESSVSRFESDMGSDRGGLWSK